GHTIVQTVPQMVMNMTDFRMDVQQAIAAPRLSFVEPDLTAIDEQMPAPVAAELARLGHKVTARRLGNAHGLTIEYDKQGRPERFTGGADPRGEGAAEGRWTGWSLAQSFARCTGSRESRNPGYVFPSHARFPTGLGWRSCHSRHRSPWASRRTRAGAFVCLGPGWLPYVSYPVLGRDGEGHPACVLRGSQ